jgi:zinc protease
MRPSNAILASCLSLAICAGAAPAAIAAKKPAAVSVVEKLAPVPTPDISYTKFVLGNGLTLIVHEDHKAPIVAVNIWYHVGSKNEPAGRTGFAHLFEHLMFGGKNANQKGWFEKMEAMGATDLNGTTSYDRTNFFETVPVGALDTTLYLEARRMGHLLDDFNEAVLTTQRGVVENEKRQSDNQPYHIADDLITKSVWPASHPYSHTVIGEMTDLDAAKVADVKDWFAKFYGPSNAVISISGDITPAEAKAKVEQFFGAIPPGPPVPRQKAWIAKRAGSQRAVAEDHIALAQFTKVWNVPGYGTADAVYLDLASTVLAWGKDSRLYRRLVLQDKIAVDVGVWTDSRELAGLFQIQITAKAGVGLDRIEAACNDEMAKMLRDGPTADELERAKMRNLAGFVRGVERVGGFGGTSDILAESETYTGTPDGWKTRIARQRDATLALVKEAARHWLSDGDFTLEIVPFGNYAAVGSPPAIAPVATVTHSKGLGKLERAKLSNGLDVIVIARHAVPTVTVMLSLDAGNASDPLAKPGNAVLALSALFDGTTTLDTVALGERSGSLGLSFGWNIANDYTAITMDTLKTRLDPALDLFADMLLRPGYRDGDVAREKSLVIAQIRQTMDYPQGVAYRLSAPLVFGPGHAYGQLMTEASVAALTPDDIKRYHAAWFQPNGASLIVVGDTTLKDILPKLEARFASWKPIAHPVKAIGPAPVRSAAVVYLVDKPDTGQSVIVAAEPAPPRVNPDDLAIRTLNTVLGGAFTSRLNMNLREDKHWSYGAFSGFDESRGASLFLAGTSVQADKTAESVLEMRKEFADILAARPVTADELALAKNNLTRSLPGRWETNGSVVWSVGEIAAFSLSDDYYDLYPGRITALDTADVARAAKTVVRPGALVWIVVGDRSKVEPALKAKGIVPVIIDADGKPVK